MKLPYLSEIPNQKKQVIEFKGYNHNPHIKDGEFYDMANLTSSLYPVLSPRNTRGTVQELTKPNGLFAKNALVWVDGTDFYYDGEYKGSVTDTLKQFVSMGAYILIFPDKKIYNTVDGTLTALESYFTSISTVTITACTYDGTYADPATSLYTKISTVGIDTNFKAKDGVIISGCTVDALNGSKVIHMIGLGYIIISAKITSYTAQETPITVNRTVPSMDFLTESGNRVWGCSSSKHEVYASKLGDPFNWNCFEGISTDSYAATIGSDGDFTGVVAYGGYVLFFKEDCIHKVHGSKPSNFQIYESPGRGVAEGSEKSIAIVNETLYYMSRSGVMVYGGGAPESISYVFGEVKYTDAVAGAIDDKYYISMKDSANTWHLFVYDEELGVWHREDNTHATYFTYLDGKLYYMNGTKLMTVSGGDTERIKWYADFSDYSEKTTSKMYVSKLQFRVELEAGSILDIWIKYDGTTWERVSTLTGLKRQSYNIPVRLRRCDSYQIRLSGIGQCKLYSMVKTITEGSDL